MNIDTMLETVIESLNDGALVSAEAKEDPSKGYPYSYGYIKATNQYAVDQLKTIVDQYRSLMIENNQ